LADFSFEIDDAGNPFGLLRNMEKIGFSKEDLLWLMQSGVINEYSIAKTSKWVDQFSLWILSKIQL
jgi:hypothetical protein